MCTVRKAENPYLENMKKYLRNFSRFNLLMSWSYMYWQKFRKNRRTFWCSAGNCWLLCNRSLYCVVVQILREGEGGAEGEGGVHVAGRGGGGQHWAGEIPSGRNSGGFGCGFCNSVNFYKTNFKIKTKSFENLALFLFFQQSSAKI